MQRRGRDPSLASRQQTLPTVFFGVHGQASGTASGNRPPAFAAVGENFCDPCALFTLIFTSIWRIHIIS